MSGDAPDEASYTSKIGFATGVIAEYALKQDIRFSIQPSYARRGTGVGFDTGEEELRDSLALTLDYLSIPVVARFLSPGGSWFFNGGVDVGFLLDASLKDRTTGSTNTVESSINGVDVMMILGAGAIIPVDPALITLELRYLQSVTNAAANDELNAAAGIPLRFRSSGIQFLASVLFPL
jgi:hypothetical protein